MADDRRPLPPWLGDEPQLPVADWPLLRGTRELPGDDPDWLKAKGALAHAWDGEPAEVTIRRQRDEGWD